jgi:hypothetical protein
MLPNGAIPPDCITWVRNVNARWIVHHNLGRNAEQYLELLSQTDPSRLLASCRNACLMLERCDPLEDPKPWFYSGLFSLAKPDEARRFLAGHWLTSLVTPAAREIATTTPAKVGELTQDIIRRLQDALAGLPASPP